MRSALLVMESPFEHRTGSSKVLKSLPQGKTVLLLLSAEECCSAPLESPSLSSQYKYHERLTEDAILKKQFLEDRNEKVSSSIFMKLNMEFNRT